MANPAPTINQINAFNATQGTTIDFNIIGGTDLVRSNIIYIYDLDDNSLICTHLYVSTESIHELPANTDSSIVYESGKSSADFVNGKQYYAQIQTFTDIGGTEGGSGLSVAKMFWCLNDPTLTIDTIPSTISTTSYNVSATYNANISVVSNIIQQYQFNLYSATGSLLQSSGVIVGNGEQQGTSTVYDISYNFTGLSVGSSYYVVVDVTTTQGMSVNAQSSTFTVSIDTPTLGEATVVNNACDGYISVTSNLSSEYGGSGSGDIVSFETDSENIFTKLQVELEPTQSGSGTPSPSNVRPIYGVGGVDVNVQGKNLIDWEITEHYFDSNFNGYGQGKWQDKMPIPKDLFGKQVTYSAYINAGNTNNQCVRVWFLKNGSYVGSAISGNYIQSNNSGISKVTFTIANSDTVDSFALGLAVNDSTVSNPQLELGSTATSYEPYIDPLEISQDFNVSLTPTSKDTDPYLFKAVGDIYGDRLDEELVGGSVVWNQLVANADFSNGNTDWATSALSYTVTNGVAECTMANSSYGSNLIRSTKEKCVAGHKYFASVEAKIDANATSLTNLYWGVRGHLTLSTVSKTSFVKLESVINCTASNDIFIVGNGTSGTAGDKYFITKPQVYDLTAMFGSTIADYVYTLEQGTAGAGVAWLKARGFFTKSYYAYDIGTIKSVEATAHVTRGVNAWDEEWELGTYNTTTGAKASGSSNVRNKNYIDVLPSTTYYFNVPYTIYIFRYDADKNLIAYGGMGAGTFTTESNCRYINFYMTSTYGTTYNNDICINISDPTINGKYFPYEEHTYPLGDVTLRGIPKLVNNELVYDGDIYKYDGAVTRKYGVVDLGTLNWDKEFTNRFRLATDIGAKLTASTSQLANIICSKYPTDIQDHVTSEGYDKIITGLNWGRGIIVKDSTYSTSADFKTAMSGVYLVYELATPTTETTTPFEQIQEVSKYGTLEYITNNGIPVGHNTTYLTRDVFGGTDDLVSGQLVVDWKYALGDTLDWVYVSSGAYFYAIISDKEKGYNNVICNIYATAQQAGVANLQNNQIVGGMNDTAVYVKDSRYTDATTFKQAMSETGILYKLATPLTYQLTPKHIQTLVGTNNVWSEQGNIELAYHIPITNLLVKRQDVDDVSGNWLTLYSQPITQASDMDFTFIDFLNQYGKTYKYALVPLLTQTQSGVEVEVEGGYTVSDEVQSIFDGVFISDSTGSQKCKANVGYGSVNMNQSVGSITPIGSQYPIIVTNSNNRYHNGSISGMIVPDDYYYNGNLSRIDMVNKRNELEQFLTNKRAKIIKDWNSNIWLVMIMDNIDCSFDNNYGMGMVTFNANWLEIGDPTNQEDLQATGLVDVGGV